MGVKYLIKILLFCILYALRILNLLKKGLFLVIWRKSIMHLIGVGL